MGMIRFESAPLIFFCGDYVRLYLENRVAALLKTR